MKKSYFTLFGGVAIALGLSWAAPLLAAGSSIPIHPGIGVSGVLLGATDGPAVETLKKTIKLPLATSGKDTEYEGQVVYYYFFGAKNSDNHHALQVYSDVKRKVFIFEINSPAFATLEGIKVGSSEAALQKAYKNLKKSQRGKIYTKYSLGGRKGTDFYVRNGAVTQILIRDY